MNSRNRFGKHFKTGLQRNNEQLVFSEMIRVKEYILHLKDSEKHLIYNSGRRAGFVGFLICIVINFDIY